MTANERLATRTLRDWRVARREVLDGRARRADVHAWRIATRRLLAVSQLCSPSRDTRELEHLLDRPFHAAGRLRDAQVGIGLARSLAPAYPLAADLCAWLRERVPRQRRRLLRRLERTRWRELREVLVRGCAARSGRDGDLAARRLAASLRRVAALQAALSVRSPPAAWHRLRLEVKRARYMSECIAPLSGAGAHRERARRLAACQATLGEMEDVGSLAAALSTYAGTCDGRVPGAAGLRRELSRRQGKMRREALRRWSDDALGRAGGATAASRRARRNDAHARGSTADVDAA